MSCGVPYSETGHISHLFEDGFSSLEEEEEEEDDKASPKYIDMFEHYR